MENAMSIRICALASVAVAIGASVATEASAFFSRPDDRPPPNGANGLATNGFSLRGFASEVTAVTAVTLQDGTRVVLK